MSLNIRRFNKTEETKSLEIKNDIGEVQMIYSFFFWGFHLLFYSEEKRYPRNVITALCMFSKKSCAKYLFDSSKW
ncbi:CLUMA_CG003520, isoform A [Clunio marinus]|uniref:CLUMA_CG003520, isoform A n=1 Tax=Clunio marinus TaxID=568069 RepID=A0A1J1HTI0_9DIPT|nr:CLUMA_CG003520, isoform A [Clunio marinus]